MVKPKKSKIINSRRRPFGIQPTAGNVLLEPEEATYKTPSGIVLPESAGEKPQKGKVLAVGDPEVTDSGARRSAPCKVGDTVFYKKWGGNEIKIDGKEYLFVRFEDILAIEA